MEQEYNIGDLWEWARSGRLTSFTLVKNGQPVCWIMRVNGDGMDWFYAQYEPDNGTFSVPFEPFGMWAWSEERMGCVRDEYAGLGNWSLPDAERRLEDAYRGAAAAEVQREADELLKAGAEISEQDVQAAEVLAARLAEMNIPAGSWASSGLVALDVPQFYPGALFLDEGGEIGRVLQSVNSDNPQIRDAAHLIAALQKDEQETAPPLEPEPQANSETESTDTARDAIYNAIHGQRVKKLVVITQGKSKEHRYTVRRVGLVKDLEKGDSIQTENVLEGDPKGPITADAIEKITTLSGKEVLYSKQ